MITTSLPRLFSRGALAAIIGLYTFYTLAPFVWLATMSVRTTGEISLDHYAWPEPFHWGNSAAPGSIQILQHTSGINDRCDQRCCSRDADWRCSRHCLARFRFSGNRLIYGVLFSSIIFPPQITLISLYQFWSITIYMIICSASLWCTYRFSCL